MKKLLSVLLVSILLIGCSENRVLIDELTKKGKSRDILMYYEGVLFNGIGFNIYSNGQLGYEGNFKDGKTDGLWKGW
jgi:antitoxin component YwqK of YwqJK toxin-antitoxin module